MDIEKIKDQHKTIRAFKKAFGSEEGKLVLKELERYCFFRSTTISPEQPAVFAAEGRRQVYLQILYFLDLDLEKLQQTIEERIANAQE